MSGRFVSLLNIMYGELQEYFSTVLRFIPGRLGRFLRYRIYKRRFKGCGEEVYIPETVFFKGFENIELGEKIWFSPYNSIFAESFTNEAGIKIGNNVLFNRNVMVNADVKGEIMIEDNVIMGPNVVIRASGHRYENIHLPIREQGHHSGRIIIKAGTWIGANAVILPNVTVGKEAIVAGGAPAKKIGSRLENQAEYKMIQGAERASSTKSKPAHKSK
jgi:galactoside O-acetyltransferase